MNTAAYGTHFPTIADSLRLERLRWPDRAVRMVLDSDAYNEVDDQFALVHALLSPEKLAVQAIYAAPFHNERSTGPADGMHKSYEEILRLLARLQVAAEGLVFPGAEAFLGATLTPQPTPAARDLVARALASPADAPLYVVAIGAVTNVATALLLEPRIAAHIVVVWLGGHALWWPDTAEFNLRQDIHAARLLFDCGVPLIHLPCHGVVSHLLTTLPELDAHVRGRGRIGDYLADTVKAYAPDLLGWSKVVWDMAAVGWLLNGDWVPTELVHSPIVTDQLTWSTDRSRHLIRSAFSVQRDPLFGDLFAKLTAHAALAAGSDTAQKGERR